MNFITYINQQGVFKTAECSAADADGFLKTVSSINENYLVTAVFVNSVKRKVIEGSGVSPVQCAVINDDNFDGNLLDGNHYNVEGTKFEAFLIDLVVSGGGSPVVQAGNFPYLKKITVNWFGQDAFVDFVDLPDFAKKLLLGVSSLGLFDLPGSGIVTHNTIYGSRSQVFVNSYGYGVASSDVIACLAGDYFFVPAGMPFFFSTFFGRARTDSDGANSYFTGFVCLN